MKTKKEKAPIYKSNKDLYTKELEFKLNFAEHMIQAYIENVPLKERIEIEKEFLKKEYNTTGIISEFGSFFYPEIYKKKTDGVACPTISSPNGDYKIFE